MYLDLLNAGCFPTWPEVFAIAECVMQQLQQEDPEFHDHLKSIATINVQGSPKVRKSVLTTGCWVQTHFFK